MKINVLFAAEYYFANPPLIHISRELAKRKHNVSVATSYRAVDKKTLETEVRVFEIDPLITIYKIPRAVTFPPLKMSKIFREQQVEIVHSPNDYSNNVATAAVVAKATKRPFVYAIQGTGTRTKHLVVNLLINAYNWTAARWLLREARKVILLSEGLVPTAEEFGVQKGKIAVIPSGVDNIRFNPECDQVKEGVSQLKEEFNISDEIIIGYVGRLYSAKGLTNLFSAVKEIAGNNRKIALLIVGDGAQRRELETLSKELKIRAVFTGWQHDTVPYYSLMDIFALPSLYEGLPNVVLEAMAMKKPVVATMVGGVPDVLTNGVNGFLVPVGDVSQMTAALKRLIEDEELRKRMGRTNRQEVEEHFLWSHTADKVERIYKEIL